MNIGQTPTIVPSTMPGQAPELVPAIAPGTQPVNGIPEWIPWAVLFGVGILILMDR